MCAMIFTYLVSSTCVYDSWSGMRKPFSFVYKLCCVFQNFVLHIILRRLWLKTLSTDYLFKCVNSSNFVQVSIKQVPFSYTQPNNSEYIYVHIAAFLICIYIWTFACLLLKKDSTNQNRFMSDGLRKTKLIYECKMYLLGDINIEKWLWIIKTKRRDTVPSYVISRF